MRRWQIVMLDGKPPAADVALGRRLGIGVAGDIDAGIAGRVRGNRETDAVGGCDRTIIDVGGYLLDAAITGLVEIRLVHEAGIGEDEPAVERELDPPDLEHAVAFADLVLPAFDLANNAF